MKLILGLVAISAIAYASADFNCSLEAQLECLKYRPNILQPFMRNEKEMAEFCGIFREEKNCLGAMEPRCVLNPSVSAEYNAMRRISRSICMNPFLGDNIAKMQMYITSTSCINRALPYLGQACTLAPPGISKDRCDEFTKYALCAEAFMETECHKERTAIFVDIFKMTYSVFKPENCTIRFRSTIM